MSPDDETRVEADPIEATVTYTMLPTIARELAQILSAKGLKANDSGWLHDAAELNKAASIADGGVGRR